MMVLDKQVKILYFEDDPMSQRIMAHRLTKKFGVKMFKESTLNNLENYFKYNAVYDCFDLIICDYCFRGEDISRNLKTLASIPKTILFNTCLDRDDWESRIIRILGKVPDNFIYTQKASYSEMEKIDKIVEEISCGY